MPKLLWDQPGERLYETGLDRGVLYLKNKMPFETAVPWNGLKSVDEDMSEETTNPVFIDGVKFLDQPTFSDYAATLKAVTYPDEFYEFEGFQDLGQGVFVDDQPVNTFGLSYRTLVGNDTEADELGYQIHLVYNLMAVPETKAHTTLGNSSEPTDFGWSLSAVPEDIDGHRPTAHVILDSRYLSPTLLTMVENMIYGSDTNHPYLPPLNDLNSVMDLSALITIYDNEDGTWSAQGPEDLITKLMPTEFQITEAPAVYLDEYTYRFGNAVLRTELAIVDNEDGSWTAFGPPDLVEEIEETIYDINGVEPEYIDEDTYDLDTIE